MSKMETSEGLASACASLPIRIRKTDKVVISISIYNKGEITLMEASA